MFMNTGRTAFALASRHAMKRSTMNVSRRTFATQGPSSASSTGRRHALLTASAFAAGAAAYYMYTGFPVEAKAKSDASNTPEVKSQVKSTQYKGVDYQAVYNDIANLLEDESWDDGSWGPQFLRNAWHTSGTYDKETKTGGSYGGTIRFPMEGGYGANNGLRYTRDRLEHLIEKYPGLSYGDLYTLAGVCAIKELGGPDVAWRPGRVDKGAEAQTPDGRLPDGDKGSKHVHDIFGRMGFNEQETVALIGAHALGRCHPNFSGFEGPWTHSPTSFTNAFYQELTDEKWSKGRSAAKLPQYWNADKSEMMLYTDYSLFTDPNYRMWVDIYATDEDRFFKDFSKAISTLFELGCPTESMGPFMTFESPEY